MNAARRAVPTGTVRGSVFFGLFRAAAVLIAGAGSRHVKAWVKGIEVFGVQLILHRAECFTESLEVYDLAGAKEADGVSNFRQILYHAQDVIVGGASLLLWHDLVSTTYTKI